MAPSNKIDPPGRSRARWRLPRRLLLLVVSSAMMLFLAEVAVRLIVPKDKFLSWTELADYAARAERASEFMRADLELGHVPLLAGPHYDEFGVLRGSRRRTGRDPRTLFVGDSVTCRGFILDGLHKLSPGGTLWNAGVEGWSPLQIAECYLANTRRVQPQRVVFTFHNNDFSHTPVPLWTDAGFSLCIPGTIGAFDPGYYRYSWLYRLWINARYSELMVPKPVAEMQTYVAANVRRLRDAVREDGGELQMLLLPPLYDRSDWQDGETESYDTARLMFEQLGLPCIELLEPIEQLLAAGIRTQQTLGDVWHPSRDAGLAMAFHALQQGVFAEWSGSLRSNTYAITAGEGSQQLDLQAGHDFAGRPYRVIASSTGVVDGLQIGQDIQVAEASLSRRAEQRSAQAEPKAQMLESVDGRLDAAGNATIEVFGPDMSQATEPRCVFHVAVVYDEQGKVVLVTNHVPLFVAP